MTYSGSRFFLESLIKLLHVHHDFAIVSIELRGAHILNSKGRNRLDLRRLFQIRALLISPCLLPDIASFFFLLIEYSGLV